MRQHLRRGLMHCLLFRRARKSVWGALFSAKTDVLSRDLAGSADFLFPQRLTNAIRQFVNLSS